MGEQTFSLGKKKPFIYIIGGDMYNFSKLLTANYSYLYEDGGKRERSYIRFGTALFKAKNSEKKKKKKKHDQLWKWRMSAAFVWVLGLCCGIGGRWQCATHNLKLTSGIRWQ